MQIKHLELCDANAFVAQHHRHHKPVAGHRYSLGCYVDDRLCGVAIVGRPVARGLDAATTLEVLRLCTDGTRNACSFLYSAARRAAIVLGYSRIITYILDSETGSSLRGAGWVEGYVVHGRSWSCASRTRVDKHPTTDKRLYEAVMSPSSPQKRSVP